MEKVLECPRCRTEPGTERSTSIRNPVMLEVTFGTTDQTLLSNGFSISCMVAPVNSSCRDTLSTMDAESGSDWPSSPLPSTSSDHASVRESTITTLTIISTSRIDLTAYSI